MINMQNIISNFESISEEHASKYAGEWVAVIDNMVVAHGKSFREVYEKAKKQFPDKRPLIGKLPESMPIVFSNI